MQLVADESADAVDVHSCPGRIQGLPQGRDQGLLADRTQQPPQHSGAAPARLVFCYRHSPWLQAVEASRLD